MILKQKSSLYSDKKSNKKSNKKALLSGPIFGVRSFAFSLLELLVVLSLLIILFTFTIPKQRYFTCVLLQNEIDQLYTTFSFLRNKAIASNTKQELHIFSEKNFYTYYTKNKITTHKLCPLVSFGYIPNSKGTPASPKKIITRAITFKKIKRYQERYHRVIFSENGKISTGTIYLTDKKQKLMKALTCSPAQVSFIRTYDYKNKKWVQK